MAHQGQEVISAQKITVCGEKKLLPVEGFEINSGQQNVTNMRQSWGWSVTTPRL